MDDFQQLVLAGLVHDLDQLLNEAGVADTPASRNILDFADLETPALTTILEQAEVYAAPDSDVAALITDRPLVSIFSRVHLWADEEMDPHYHHFAPLPATDEPQDVLFPVAAAEVSGSVTEQVQRLSSGLNWIATTVDTARFDRVYAHLLALLQQHAWCLPSHHQDVSVFDHAKLTSAIAAVLYRYHGRGVTPEDMHDAHDSERFRLLVGDLSGIQNYIFDIANIGAGGVARRLRARSFYLSAMADVISHQITRHFDLPLGNVIMSSGGKFYVLLPNQPDAAEQINGLRRDLDQWLREQFNGEIAVNLASTPFRGELFQAGSQARHGFGDVLTELSFKLNREKRHRGLSVLARNGAWREDAFVIDRRFSGLGVCASCGKFPRDRAESLCGQCERDVHTGRQLPRAQYVAYYDHIARSDSIPMPGSWSVRALAPHELAEAGDAYLVIKLNEPDIEELAQCAGGFRYLANHVPVGDDDAHLTFEDIAKAADGRPLLGYVKADVDYLGILFAQGLRRDSGGSDTATHLAALSRELDLFFSGWVQHALASRREPAGADYAMFYTIFSGGDDLFVVGPWDKAIALALMINRVFSQFNGGNPDITLSAGVEFTKERYPISRAASHAEDVLERAKDGRNRIAVLGDVLTWSEVSPVLDEIEMLQGQGERLTSAFLHDLVEYHRLYALWVEKQEIEGLRYKALFAYNIARNLRKGDSRLYHWADELMRSLHRGGDNITMQHLGLVATYVLFRRRQL